MKNVENLNEYQTYLLSLCASGLSNAEIAKLLTIAEQTVKNNFQLIFAKLGVNNRIDANNKFLEAAIIEYAANNKIDDTFKISYLWGAK